jgi:hypothetical protein
MSVSVSSVFVLSCVWLEALRRVDPSSKECYRLSIKIHSMRLSLKRRNSQHRSLLSAAQSLPNLVGHHLRLSKVLERISRPSCEPLYTTDISHRKQETFLYEYRIEFFFPQKTQNRSQLFSSTLLKQGRHFHYSDQSLNMRMRVCYLDCHAAGLCCYLVIHIGNLLHPLQLFYLHL